MAIVPAVPALLGRRAWWLPGRLDRILPNVDVEGEGLRPADTADEAEAPGPAAEPGAGARLNPAYAPPRGPAPPPPAAGPGAG